MSDDGSENGSNDRPEVRFDKWSKVRALQPEQAKRVKEINLESNEFALGARISTCLKCARVCSTIKAKYYAPLLPSTQHVPEHSAFGKELESESTSNKSWYFFSVRLCKEEF